MFPFSHHGKFQKRTSSSAELNLPSFWRILSILKHLYFFFPQESKNNQKRPGPLSASATLSMGAQETHAPGSLWPFAGILQAQFSYDKLKHDILGILPVPQHMFTFMVLLLLSYFSYCKTHHLSWRRFQLRYRGKQLRGDSDKTYMVDHNHKLR